MRKFVSTAILVTMMLTLSSNAFAQRDAGARARGDLDSFWSPRYSQRGTTTGRQFVRRSRTLAAPMRRAVSVRPATPLVTAPQASVDLTPATVPVSTITTTTVPNNRVGTSPRVRLISPQPTHIASRPLWMYQKTDPHRYNH